MTFNTMIFLALSFFPKEIPLLFTSDPEAIEIFIRTELMITLYMFLNSITQVQQGIIKGLGK